MTGGGKGLRSLCLTTPEICTPMTVACSTAYSAVRSRDVSGGGYCDGHGRGFVHAGSSSFLGQRGRSQRPFCAGDEAASARESACGVAAEKRVKHGQLHALLVSSAPRDHGALAVGRVQVVSVTRECEAERESSRKRQ